ncbi:branched-chain amino acid ABC transporter permease [bacterium]|nr:branched-chain amino acid ABC transporter permease [bacterium]
MEMNSNDKPPMWKWLLKGYGPFLIFFLIALGVYHVPVAAVGEYNLKIYTMACIAIVMAVSLNVVNGYTGQFSLGHASFMAVGGYTSGFVTYYGSFKLWGDTQIHGGLLGSGDWLFFGSMIAGGLVAAAFGWLVGLPSLRLRGDYLAIVTLGFGEIVRVILQRSSRVIYDAEKVAETPVISFVNAEKKTELGGLVTHIGGTIGFDGLPKYTNLFWVTFVALAVIFVCYRLKASIHGRAFIAIRENEIAAEAMGVNTTKYKVRAFVIAAFFAGIGGALFAHEQATLLNPRELGFQRSLDYVIMVVLGGMGSISGSILAAIGLTILPELLRSVEQFRMIVYALLLIIVMIWRPQGLFGIYEIWELPWLRRLVGRIFGRRPKQ